MRVVREGGREGGKERGREEATSMYMYMYNHVYSKTGHFRKFNRISSLFLVSIKPRPSTQIFSQQFFHSCKKICLEGLHVGSRLVYSHP